MANENIYSFSAKIWLYQGQGAWHFVTLPEDLAQHLDFRYEHLKKGFGSLPVEAIIGTTRWKTSIFPDKKSASYLLPIKKQIREKEQLHLDATYKVSLEIIV